LCVVFLTILSLVSECIISNLAIERQALLGGATRQESDVTRNHSWTNAAKVKIFAKIGDDVAVKRLLSLCVEAYSLANSNGEQGNYRSGVSIAYGALRGGSLRATATGAAERRVIETIEEREVRTPFLNFGDRLEMEARYFDGRDVPFGRVDQRVIAAR
jgi:hypothetical protein